MVRNEVLTSPRGRRLISASLVCSVMHMRDMSVTTRADGLLATATFYHNMAQELEDILTAIMREDSNGDQPSPA